MDKQSAKRFKLHIHEAIKELSSALLVAHEVCAVEEIATIKRSMGNIIAAAEMLLHDSIYSHHPELNELSRKPSET
ncbi:hypothetical protein [Bradyrhizobium sp. Tv2a-2]|uniref:hypothetical protein n=1 Tax=Bradyrhizobium sp. Tv2a-2 TaxID=113395 RepID=UPI0012EB071E|nr:hypothetical protein [Bradyrhizobium sp. Tv2a-2]